MHIEREIKFFFPLSKLADLKFKLRDFKYVYTKHEITFNYDNPNPDFTFYDKKIDGRLRLRVMHFLDQEHKNKTLGLFSWKQRIPEYASSKIRHEHEIECHISGEDVENLKDILTNVLKCPLVSSYERERSHYHVDRFDITLDRFPFGLMLEIEEKKPGAESELDNILEKLCLEKEKASHFSCDDMYKYLCGLENKSIKNNILFNDKEMPLIKDEQER